MESSKRIDQLFTPTSPAEADSIKKIASLIIADRLIFPQLNLPSDCRSKRRVGEIANRNSALLAAFPDYFSGLSDDWQSYEKTAGIIHGFVDYCNQDDLLHIPGQIHESLVVPDLINGDKGLTRKRQGAYYTPPYIVRYMVKKALGYVLKGPMTKHDRLKILDPACGGASFLIEVLNTLVMTGVPIEIASETLFGTDIDGDAIDMCIFVLTTACMVKSGRTGDPFKIRDSLASRIKIGNALSLPQREVSTLTNGINWMQQFPEVFRENMHCDTRGFDLIIGNPPYVSNKLISLINKEYYKTRYHFTKGQFDLAIPFLEQGLRLLRKDGVLCYITSNKFLAADYGQKIREELVENTKILDLEDISTLKSFANTAAYPVILISQKNMPQAGERVNLLTVSDWSKINLTEGYQVEQSFFSRQPTYLMTTKLDEKIMPVIIKLLSIEGRISENIIKCGLAQSGFNKWVRKPNDDIESKKEWYPFVQAGHIKPYNIQTGEFIDSALINPKTCEKMKGLKLIIPGMAKTLHAALDSTGSLLGRVYYILQSDSEIDIYYLLVLINSQVLNFYYKVMYWAVHLEGGYLRFNSTYLANLPVYEPSDKITLLGNKLTHGHLSPQDLFYTSCLAEADVFSLYGLDLNEAELIMNFLGTDSVKRDMIIEILKRG